MILIQEERGNTEEWIESQTDLDHLAKVMNDLIVMTDVNSARWYVDHRR